MEKIPDIIHPSWHQYLQPLFDDPKMLLIKNKILPEHKYYPASKDIFRVFAMPLDKIKVVIIGQDPYPNGQATGLAFAVSSMTTTPKSLNIIRQEIINTKVERDTSVNIDSHKWKELNHWMQQGVFLLNAGLTVEVKAAGSHILRWQWFTKSVIEIVSKYSQVRPVWLLWGSKAKSFKDYIAHTEVVKTIDNLVVDANMNYILEADHPAAETYPGSKYKFSGCNHFKLCNQILKAKGQTIINW